MTYTSRSFPIQDIAQWALPQTAAEQSLLRVQLPALQRGSIWSVQQVERLWDSLVRGFPIGSLILVEPRPHLGSKPFAPQKDRVTNSADAGHLLLDGQQRSTAIAIAFLDPWRNIDHGSAEFAFWVDLEAPPPSLPNEYVFRLLTRSHPWGYQRQDPAQRLSISARRSAMHEFEASAKNIGVKNLVFRPGHLDLANAWPHDARAPLPLIFILRAIERADDQTSDTIIWKEVRESLSRLREQVDWLDSESSRGALRRELGVRLHAALEKPTTHMSRLLGGLRRLMTKSESGLRIPAQWLPSEHINSAPPGTDEVDREDPVLTLFVRINTAGSQPSTEELIYSILKSVMPECREGIENLSRRFILPARMVLLLSTLTLTNLSARKNDFTPPAFPDVNRFRRLVQGADASMPEFREKLHALLASGKAKLIIEATYRLLVIDPEKGWERAFRLLPLQVARIAQNHEHAFLLLLVWVQSRLARHEGDAYLGLDEEAHRRVVGLICVLGWFSAGDINTVTVKRKYLRRLWSKRYVLHEPGVLASIGEADGSDEDAVLPIPPPKIVLSAIEKCVTGHGFGGYATRLWQEWDMWTNFRYRLDDIGLASDWYIKHIKARKVGDEKETDSFVAKRRQAAWEQFVSKTVNNTELVIYAQRKTLSEWYPEFDPTSPSQLQDTEQPWDIDHIHPQSYVQGRHSMPPLITSWHSTIGNLRAWPSEINRAQHDLVAQNKLEKPNEQESSNYGLCSSKDLIKASAIEKAHDWIGSYPNTSEWVPGYYLRNGDIETHKKWQPNRQALVRAITARYVALFSEWYRELRIGQLS